MDLSHYHLSAPPFFDGSCGAWPKALDEFLGQAPNLLVFDGYGISYNGKTS